MHKSYGLQVWNHLFYFAQCDLTDDRLSTFEHQVPLTVASKAIVEFKDLYGTVTFNAGEHRDISCIARKARPLGKFKWKLEINGEQKSITNPSQAKVTESHGLYDAIEVCKKK